MANFPPDTLFPVTNKILLEKNANVKCLTHNRHVGKGFRGCISHVLVDLHHHGYLHLAQRKCDPQTLKVAPFAET